MPAKKDFRITLNTERTARYVDYLEAPLKIVACWDLFRHKDEKIFSFINNGYLGFVLLVLSYVTLALAVYLHSEWEDVMSSLDKISDSLPLLVSFVIVVYYAVYRKELYELLEYMEKNFKYNSAQGLTNMSMCKSYEAAKRFWRIYTACTMFSVSMYATMPVIVHYIYSEEHDAATMSALRDCAMLCQAIKRYTEMFEDFVSPLLALRVVQVTLYLCTLLYAATLKLEMTTVEYLAAVALDIFVYCYYGNQIIIQADRVSTAAYQSVWHTMGVGPRRVLLNILLANKKLVVIRAGKFLPMDLHTFVVVCMPLTAWKLLDYSTKGSKSQSSTQCVKIDDPRLFKIRTFQYVICFGMGLVGGIF
ncbi:unnamed protein product [Arctia plantaginis]|uniref:Odorant receptor n=1 Tax=Arctia plantaginis TaxID=874455 RepID=A0A8S0YLE2_ARCPL|nr:unnamed protein product [Arctia plantaginis]